MWLGQGLKDQTIDYLLDFIFSFIPKQTNVLFGKCCHSFRTIAPRIWLAKNVWMGFRCGFESISFSLAKFVMLPWRIVCNEGNITDNVCYTFRLSNRSNVETSSSEERNVVLSTLTTIQARFRLEFYGTLLNRTVLIKNDTCFFSYKKLTFVCNYTH